MPITAAQQRVKYLAKKTCGNCSRPADAMRPWGAGRKIPICARCQGQLDEALRQVEDLERDLQWDLEHEPEPDYDPYGEE